jgi:hypothetical protein
MGFSDPVGRLYRRAAAAREQNLTSYLQQVFSWLRDAGAGQRKDSLIRVINSLMGRIDSLMGPN